MSDYGNRLDGTKKSTGFFGELKRPDGQVSTELSIGVDFGKGETQIPMLVPTLDKSEIDYLLSGGQPTKAIVDKAAEFALTRLKSGLSPFAAENERVPMPAPSGLINSNAPK